MNLSQIIAIIEKDAATVGLTGPAAETFIKWLTGFIGALPAIESGAADVGKWLQTGFRVATEGDVSNAELDQILADLKSQLATSDASVAADQQANS